MMREARNNRTKSHYSSRMNNDTILFMSSSGQRFFMPNNYRSARHKKFVEKRGKI